jgi:hypothetical protein
LLVSLSIGHLFGLILTTQRTFLSFSLSSSSFLSKIRDFHNSIHSKLISIDILFC